MTHFRNLKAVLSIVILLTSSIFAYARDGEFHSPYFDISLPGNLKLISRTEQKKDEFYRYVFGTSKDDNAESQMRVIVSGKKQVLHNKPDKIKLGAATFTGVKMYFGSMDASFLVTIISNNTSEKVRQNNLQMLTNQLQSIKFKGSE